MSIEIHSSFAYDAYVTSSTKRTNSKYNYYHYISSPANFCLMLDLDEYVVQGELICKKHAHI